MKRLFFTMMTTMSVGFAAQITPISYTATPGEGQAQQGTYNYFDDTGRQLTDNVFGVNNWAADLGNGNAYEWVGWRVANPTVTFTFSAPVTLNQVIIGFNHTEAAGIFLPATVTIGGVNNGVLASAIADNTRGSLTFNVNLNNITSTTISFTDSDPTRWVFVDEVQFFGDTAVPEPATWGWVGAGLAALWVRSQRGARR